jgi:hypothetical protein
VLCAASGMVRKLHVGRYFISSMVAHETNYMRTFTVTSYGVNHIIYAVTARSCRIKSQEQHTPHAGHDTRTWTLARLPENMSMHSKHQSSNKGLYS